jgi:hypothetical protein
VKFWMMVPGLTLYPGRGDHWWKDITPAEIALIARRAEELGYDYLFVPTHFLVQREAALEMGPRWVHSLSAANFLLGCTERITVVCLLVVPNHNPIELAKAIATADFLAPGRFLPLLMTGYQSWEFEILNVPYEERGAIMDESLEVMTELWTNELPRYDGRYVRFAEIVFEPKPSERPLPLWFGGRTKVAVRRVARYGAGWANTQVPRARFRDYVDHIRAQPEFRVRPRRLDLALPMFEGRFDPDRHVILEQPSISLEPETILAQLEQIADLGANMTSADDILGHGRYYTGAADAPPPTRSLHDYLERLEWFATEIAARAPSLGPEIPDDRR